MLKLVKNKKVIIIVTSIIIAVFLFALFLQKNRWYSQTEVASHANQRSCWTSINGSVYDVTPLANTHSGGSETILQVCGTDGSTIFTTRHGNENDPKLELEKYKIGILHY